MALNKIFMFVISKMAGDQESSPTSGKTLVSPSPGSEEGVYDSPTDSTNCTLYRVKNPSVLNTHGPFVLVIIF